MQVSLGADKLGEFSDGAIFQWSSAACGKARVRPPSMNDSDSQKPAEHGNPAFATSKGKTGQVWQAFQTPCFRHSHQDFTNMNCLIGVLTTRSRIPIDSRH